MRRNSPTQIASIATKAMSAATRWRSSSPTPSRNRRVVQAKPRLNGLKILEWWSPFFIRMAHSAGVRVNAMKPEITTAKVSVTANCR